MGQVAAFSVFVCLAASSACSSRVAPPAAAPVPVAGLDACALIADRGEPVASVGLVDRIDPANAPRPTNESERLLFRQLYETLVRVDCNGVVRPGLAASWQRDADGRAWIVTLRENARFSDGTPVTAGDVRASWSRHGAGGELGPEARRLVESVVPLGELELAITLRTPQADAPLALAHTDLAVTRPASDSLWPIGTRSGHVETRTAPDPRDLLDAGVDLLLTRDPAALEYASTLPQFQRVALAWGRTRVLLSPGQRTPPKLSDAERQALADDAVRGEARGAQGPFWWEQPACDIAVSPPRENGSLSPQIVYDASDSAARGLAERLVALAGIWGRPYQRATGLTGEALARARRLGADAGYIVSLDSRPIAPCRDLQVLIERAPWLDPAAIVPLVDTRLQAIVRRGKSGVTVEWDGGLLIAPATAPDER